MCEETTMRALWLLLGVAFLAGSGLGSRPGPGHDKLHSGMKSWRPQWSQEEECNKQSLIKYLFSSKRYWPLIRPNDGDGPVKVTQRYKLLRLVRLDYESDEQASKILCLDLWDEYSWNDPRLSWNTDKCDVADLNMPLDKVWVPDLQIDKGVGPMLDKLKRNSVIIDSNGDVRVIFDRQIKTYCDPIVINGTTAITPGDVSCGDEFKCEIQLYSWTYFDTDMKLEVGEPGGGMGMALLAGSSDFFYTVINTTSTIRSERYVCCPGNFDTIIYTIWLKKNGPGCQN